MVFWRAVEVADSQQASRSRESMQFRTKLVGWLVGSVCLFVLGHLG